MRPTHASLAASLLTLLGFSSLLSAQQVHDNGLLVQPISAQPATPDVLKAFMVSKATTQELQLPRTVGQPFQVDVELGGRRYTLDLHPHDIRARDFQVLADDGKQLTPADTGPLITYQGKLLGLDNTVVAASLVDGQLWATIHTTGGLFGVQPLTQFLPKYARNLHIVYHKRDVQDQGTRCEAVHLPNRQVDPGGPQVGNANAATHEAEIAVDADNAFFNRNLRNISNTRNAVIRVINAMDAIYQRDVGIRYKLTTILVRTTRVYSGITTGALLSEMRTRWNANHGSIRRDLAHMFTGVGVFGGVVGTAYVGVVCTSSAYGVSKAFHSSLTTNTGLVSHECGHNWSAGHCDATSPCYIMCSGLGGCNRNLTLFGTAAKSQIIAHRNSRTCLTRIIPGAYGYFGVACRGTAGSSCNTIAAQANFTATFRGANGGAGIFAIRTTTGNAARTICAIQFICKSRTTSNVTTTFRIYGATSTGRPGALLRSTAITVTPRVAAYTASVAPLTLAAGTTFFVGFDNRPNGGALTLPIAASGTNQTHFYGTTGPTNGPFTTVPWNYRVLSVGAGVAPVLSATAAPNIGKSFGLRVSPTPASAPVFLAFGVSRSSWNGLPLPFHLAIIGAPGCYINTSPDIVVGLRASTTGVMDFKTAIPANSSFIGATFYNHAMVIDRRANPAGGTWTRGGIGRVGNQ